MNTSEMKLKSVPANRISLGGIALIVAGIAVLAATLLLLGSPGNPHTEQLQVVLEADTFAYRLGLALAPVSMAFFALGTIANQAGKTGLCWDGGYRAFHCLVPAHHWGGRLCLSGNWKAGCSRTGRDDCRDGCSIRRAFHHLPVLGWYSLAHWPNLNRCSHLAFAHLMKVEWTSPHHRWRTQHSRICAGYEGALVFCRHSWRNRADCAWLVSVPVG